MLVRTCCAETAPWWPTRSRFPSADYSFDLVSCSLFAHHLEPTDLARFAIEALRVSRCAVLINDLVRHPLHWRWYMPASRSCAATCRASMESHPCAEPMFQRKCRRFFRMGASSSAESKSRSIIYFAWERLRGRTLQRQTARLLLQGFPIPQQARDSLVDHLAPFCGGPSRVP